MVSEFSSSGGFGYLFLLEAKGTVESWYNGALSWEIFACHVCDVLIMVESKPDPGASLRNKG